MSLESQSLCFAGGSDKGMVREQNEDSVLYCRFEHSDVSLMIVADGVGGHEGGAVASKFVINSIKELVAKAVLLAHSGGGYAEEWLQNTLLNAIEEANNELLIEQRNQPQYRNMATTVVALLINEDRAVLGHLGDSRCYLYANSKLTQLTEDHTVLQNLLNEGKITKKQFNDLPLHHMISKAIGLTSEPEISVSRFELKPDSEYLLCSDGLTNSLSDEEIESVLSHYSDLSNCVDELITRANDNGGEDNISVIVLKHCA